MLRNIPEILRRIKQILAGDLFIILLIVFVGLLSFGLGRLSLLKETRIPVRIINSITQNASAGMSGEKGDSVNNISNASNGSFVGSKNGSKYHFPWCSGAGRIKEENKVWFSTKEEAERAGYTPAANCPGL